MLHIAICDDEQIWIENTKELLKEYLEKHPQYTAKIHSFLSGMELLEYTESNGGFDLYILDIVMTGMTGIETGLSLRRNADKGIIIYLTTSKEYALDSFDTNPYHYLVKPVDKMKMNTILDKVFYMLTEKKNKGISVKTKEGVKRICLDDIIYVELVNRNICYHLKDGQLVVGNQQRVSFTEMMLPILKDERFCRCGASFVLNLHYVKLVNKDEVHFSNGEELLTLPKSACAMVLSEWLDYWVEGDGK